MEMLKNEFVSAFENYKIRPVALETSDCAVAKYLIKSRGYKSIVYGAGRIGSISVKFLEDILGIRPDFIVDRMPDKQEIDGVKVIDIFKAKSILTDRFLSFIAVAKYTYSDEKNNIDELLYKLGSKLNISLVEHIQNSIKPEFYLYFKEHKGELVKLYDQLADIISKETLIEYLNAHLSGDIYNGKVFAEEDKYFGQDEKKPLYRLGSEIWVNLGSCGGDTIFYFLNRNVEFRHIYAVEGEKKNVVRLKQMLDFLPAETRNKISVIDKFCGMNDNEFKIDDLLKNDVPTIINMDIEGGELDAIRSAEKVIRNYNPILAICVYHKKDDLITLTNEVLSMCSDYKLFLRKYVSGIGKHYEAIYRTNELVLYAIPPERLF